MSRLDDAYALVSIASLSRHEAPLAAHVEAQLRNATFLDVERVGDNVVARTSGRHATRVLVAGHLDTVPGEATHAKIVGDELRGVGACDMKGSLAVMLALAVDPTPRPIEVTWIFYAREEISRRESGLMEIAELRPELLQGDVAVLCEPTGGVVEAGCQGTLKLSVVLSGRRAHTARPFTGRNAIHRVGELIDRVAQYRPRTVSIDGVSYTEQLQAVAVEGGVASNVVPDIAALTLNHRVAPDRTKDEATSWLRDYLGDLVEESDTFSVLDWAPSALPSLSSDRLASLVRLTGKPAAGKMGWTDVATFQELSIPATNFGAGDPLLAHRSDEFITLEQLENFENVIRTWLA
ncbi:MAG: succinyl-diaminopimelate desuccinylase [Acidimicrobiales bacterium]